jgi:hypothetical protein
MCFTRKRIQLCKTRDDSQDHIKYCKASESYPQIFSKQKQFSSAFTLCFFLLCGKISQWDKDFTFGVGCVPAYRINTGVFINVLLCCTAVRISTVRSEFVNYVVGKVC